MEIAIVRKKEGKKYRRKIIEKENTRKQNQNKKDGKDGKDGEIEEYKNELK